MGNLLLAAAGINYCCGPCVECEGLLRCEGRILQREEPYTQYGPEAIRLIRGVSPHIDVHKYLLELDQTFWTNDVIQEDIWDHVSIKTELGRLSTLHQSYQLRY